MVSRIVNKIYNVKWIKNASFFSRTINGALYSGNDGNLGMGWTGTMKLFAATTSAGDSSVNYYTNGKLYGASIKVNNVLVRNFIPCVNASGAAGLYDTVEGKFYANKGSGSFSTGGVAYKTSYTIKDTPITLLTPTKSGYDFLGWTGSNGSTAQTLVTIAERSLGDKTYHANWKRKSASYKVNHYQENITDTNYTLAQTETFTTQNPGTSVTPTVKSYTGFNSPAAQTVTVAADGSTVVNYYYTRITYYLDLNGVKDGTSDGNISGYGTADVYVNGTLVANDVSDYYTAWKYGTTYEIKGVAAATGRIYNGVHSGAASGTITGAVSVFLSFSSATYTNTVNHITYGNGLSEVTFATTTFTAAYGSTITLNGSHRTTPPTGTTVTHYGTAAFAGTWTSYYISNATQVTQPAGGVGINLYYQYTTHTNSIDHWTWGYVNGEGNNGNKAAFHLATTTFIGAQGTTINLGTNRATTIPNGFALRNNFGTGSVTGSWQTYNMGTNLTQTSAAMGFEYDYDPITYSITYNMNGGTNHSSNPSSYNVLYGVTLQNPTRTGYTFTGWTNASGTKVTGINPGANASFSSPSDLYNKLSSRTTGNQTLTANWTPNKIKITLNANGGSGGTSAFWYYYGTSTFYSDEACTTQITAITRPTRSGYLYVHYAGDGSSGGTNGERYVAYDSSKVEFASDLATDIYKDATLYASWVEAVTITWWKSAELNWAAASINYLTSATGPVTGSPDYLATAVSPSANVYGGTTSSLYWNDTYANESGRSEKNVLGIKWSTTGVTGSSNSRSITVPKGTQLTFTINNNYCNGGTVGAIYNTNSTTGVLWGPGQSKYIGTYTYTVNSNINIRANWKTAGEYIPGVTDVAGWVASLVGGSITDDRDSWWDVHIFQ